jgi:hypothetical protein
LIKWRLQNLVTQAAFTLDELRKRVFRVIDGTRKNELTDWWLSHIERKTDLFLLSRGFVKDAIPDVRVLLLLLLCVFMCFLLCGCTCVSVLRFSFFFFFLLFS